MAIALVGTPFFEQKVAAATHTFNVALAAGGAGGVLVAFVSLKVGSTGNVTSFTDSGGHTWTQVDAGFVSGSSSRVVAFTAVRSGAAIASITVTPSATTYACSLQLYELTGADSTTPLMDTDSGGDADTAQPKNLGTLVVPSGKTAFLIHAGSWGGTASVTTYTPSSGYTAGPFAASSATLQSLATVYRIAGAGSYSATVTTNRNYTNGYAAVAIAEAPAAADHPLTGTSDGTAIGTADLIIPLALGPAYYGVAEYSGAEYGVAGTDHALSGTSAGTSASAATGFSLAQPLAGTTDGIADSTGTAITLAHPLTAGAFGQATTGGERLDLSHPLTGSVDALATAAGTRLTLAQPLSAAVSGVATSTVTQLDTDPTLSTTTDGVATVSASALTLSHPFAGVSAGDAFIPDAPLALAGALVAATAGVATAGADLSVGEGVPSNHPLIGTTDGTATVQETRIRLAQPLVADSVGLASAQSAMLRLSHPLTGDTQGTATGTAEGLLTEQTFSGSTQGSSTGTAMALRVTHVLAGDTSGAAVSTAIQLQLTHDLLAATTGSSGVSGQLLSRTHDLVGATAGVATAESLRLILSHVLLSQSNGLSTSTATLLQLSHALTAAAAGISEATALQLIPWMGGVVTADMVLESLYSGTFDLTGVLTAVLTLQPHAYRRNGAT